HPAVLNSGLATGAGALLGRRLAPGASHDARDIEHLNMMIRSAAGKMLKDADGKPTKHVQDELREVYSLEPGAPPEFNQQQLDNAQSYVNGLAREQGATNGLVPNRKVQISAELGAKPIR